MDANAEQMELFSQFIKQQGTSQQPLPFYKRPLFNALLSTAMFLGSIYLFRNHGHHLA
jgi:hypothetical protein